MVPLQLTKGNPTQIDAACPKPEARQLAEQPSVHSSRVASVGGWRMPCLAKPRLPCGGASQPRVAQMLHLGHAGNPCANAPLRRPATPISKRCVRRDAKPLCGSSGLFPFPGPCHGNPPNASLHISTLRPLQRGRARGPRTLPLGLYLKVYTMSLSAWRGALRRA